MSKTIITVKLEESGEDVILAFPDELIKQMGWKVDDPIKVDIRNGCIIIKKETNV